MAESDKEDMPVRLSQVPTLSQLYKSAVLKAAEKPRYPANAALLSRVSLWFVGA
jgi:O-acetyl-ADP-ribose deacetylase